MQLLEFMQPFDGSQPQLTRLERRQATNLFREVGVGAIRQATAEAPSPFDALTLETDGLTLLPREASSSIQEAILRNMHGLLSLTLYMPQPGSTLGFIRYRSEERNWVTRYGVADGWSIFPRKASGETDAAHFREEAAAFQEMEAAMGLNDCPVGIREVRGLQTLLNRMNVKYPTANP